MTIRFKNTKSFLREISNFGRQTVPNDLRTLQQRIALDLLRRIIFRTPVDTGRARGNWQTGIGPSTDQEVESFDPTGAAAFAAGAGVIASVPPFSVITIFNNVKYITFLENGSSQQAPRGMLKISVAEVDSQFR